jgi:glycosyltransferase involved in cell wall biosynthesis
MSSRILLVGNYRKDRSESMDRFAWCLEEEIGARGYEVEKLLPQPKFGGLLPSSGGLGKWLGYLDKFLVFPGALKKRCAKADIVHICDQAGAIYTKYLSDKPHLLTCNDLLAIRSALGEFPQNPTRWTGRKYQWIILNGIRRATRITCISEATRQDLIRIAGVPAERVDVTSMGLNHPYHVMNADKGWGAIREFVPFLKTPFRFILHVGGNQWYKNRLGVLKIYNEFKKQSLSDAKLVLIGQPLSAELASFIDSNSLQTEVFSISNCDNNALCAFYSVAGALLFPSLYEGFGWPIIEAQACGCPVITTNRPPMTEIGGMACSYIDPENLKAAADILDKVVSYNRTERQKATLEGLRNAGRFSTARMIDGYLEIYQELLAKKFVPERIMAFAS